MAGKWVIALSNGETIDETKFVGQDKTKSIWVNFLHYVSSNNLQIRHVKLVVNGIEYHSPTFGADGRFNNDAKAHGFWVNRRAIYTLLGGGGQQDVIEMSWRVGDYRHHLIVDEKSNITWTSTTSINNKQTINHAIKRHCGEDYGLGVENCLGV